MNPVLTIDFVEDALIDFVGSVGRDFVAPLDRLENLCALLSIQNGGSLGCGDLFVRVWPNYQRVHRRSSLSDSVEVARVAQVVAAVNKTSVGLILTGNFFKTFIL